MEKMNESDRGRFCMILFSRMNKIKDSIDRPEIETPMTREVDRFLKACKLDLRQDPPLTYILGAAIGWLAAGLPNDPNRRD